MAPLTSPRRKYWLICIAVLLSRFGPDPAARPPGRPERSTARRPRKSPARSKEAFCFVFPCRSFLCSNDFWHPPGTILHDPGEKGKNLSVTWATRIVSWPLSEQQGLPCQQAKARLRPAHRAQDPPFTGLFHRLPHFPAFCHEPCEKRVPHASGAAPDTPPRAPAGGHRRR